MPVFTPPPFPAFLRNRLWLIPTGLFALVLGGLTLFMLRPAPLPDSVLLIAPERSWCLQVGIPMEQGEALTTFVQDHLETLLQQPIASMESLPEQELLAVLRPRTLILELRPTRAGDLLSLGFRRCWSEDLRRAPLSAWREEAFPAQPHADAFSALLRRLGVPRRADLERRLLPQKAQDFWTLLQAQAWRRHSNRMPEAQAVATGIVQGDPECATALLLEGDILYRRLADDPSVGVDHLAQAEACLKRIQVLVPGHPRALLVQTQLWVDLGAHRLALETLVNALRRNPDSVHLQAALSYAARTSGLLDLAQRALKRRLERAPGSVRMFQPENTLLYQGDLDRFAGTLLERPGSPRNVMIRFYRGYLKFLKGDVGAAQQDFSLSAEGAVGFETFASLSRAYLLHLEGKPEEALAYLKGLEQGRLGLRAPDGEYTFKLAEALAALDQREAALDALQRAFGQGFGCTRWYEKSPLLAPLRSLPRWKGLAQHLHERQAMLEERFPAQRFGL